MNHDILRRIIIETATRYFLKYGIKNTSMSSIATMLHISKRTLYELFPSKRNLIKECVIFLLSTNRKRMKELYETTNPIETIVSINNEAYSFLRVFYPTFCKDIVYSPDVLTLFDSEYRIPLHKMYYELFNAAKRMKLMLPESNFELAFRFFENILLTESSYSWNAINQKEAYNNAIMSYLSGICTNKGRKQLNNIKKSILQ